MLRFHCFHALAAAVRPGTLTLVSLFLFFSYAHGRLALTGRYPYHVTPALSKSRDSGPLTRMFPVSVSHDFYCTRMSHGDPPRLFFVMLTFSRLCL